MRFWQVIRSYWHHALQIGHQDELSSFELVRIRVVNGTAILLSLVQVVLILIRLRVDGGWSFVSMLNVFMALLIVPVFYFNKNHLYVLARATIFFGGLSLVTAVCWNHALYGHDKSTEIILIPCSIYCALLFDGLVKYVSFLLVFFCFVLVMLIRINGGLSFQIIPFDQFINPVLAFLTVYVLTGLYRVAYDQSQKTIVAKNQQLNELNAQKDRLFSVISHDLRNPLNSLKGLMELVGKKWITEEEFQKQVSALSKNMLSTSDLIDNLLVWSQSQMKGSVQKDEVFDLGELSKEAIRLVEAQATQKKITIDNRMNGNHQVLADKNMIAVVFRNLLTNALKFSHANQTIAIDLTRVNSEYKVSVEDSGVGISSVQLPALFEFNSKSTPGTSHERGTGLGLAICKEFVEKNGGRIWVESLEGKGSKFFFTLRAAS